MKIYRMTATFGKLEHETLSLEPGLNIIQARNEWGKSTWCAFLAAMLYGLDSRAKTTKMALADKERYAPWSGSPMSGRVDLCWNGRDITIERTTRGRIPMGDFKAYETGTGIAVPELTGMNCGQLLLGVEQSVFRRSAFIRLADLPVTQDEALRRRLNALVTTGDESADGERLEQGLRELKNKCRYNRTGLLPQAELERDALEGKLRELGELQRQREKLNLRLQEVEQWIAALENHQNALNYREFQQDSQRIAQAEEEYRRAEAAEERSRQACSKLPSREEAERKIHQLQEFQEQWHTLQLESELLPHSPAAPEGIAPFSGLGPEGAKAMVQQDIGVYHQLGKSVWIGLLAAGMLCLLLGLAAAVWLDRLYLGVGAVAALAFLALGLRSRSRKRHSRAQLEQKYASQNPKDWERMAADFAHEWDSYERAVEDYRAARGDVDARLAALNTKRQSLCGAQSPDKVLQLWQQVLRRWEDYHTARRECQRVKTHLEALRSMAKTCHPPAAEDALTYTPQDTARLLSDGLAEQQRLQNRVGQCQGRMEALGQQELLEAQRSRTNDRIRKLEEVYAATELALTTLAQARRELQRRFAPRITKRAQELMQEMTDGRYRRLTFGEDFRIQAGAGEEDILRDLMWRSDGTMDQLYLALRLAVAEELLPQGILVLDDALVRFDDQRLEAALGVLNRMAQHRQVLVFTCQSRERMLSRTQREGE